MAKGKPSKGESAARVTLADAERQLGMTVDEAQALYNRLTPRQQDTARLLAQGLPTRAIAERLGIRPNTVTIYQAYVFEKLQASTGAGVARIVRLVDLASGNE